MFSSLRTRCTRSAEESYFRTVAAALPSSAAPGRRRAASRPMEFRRRNALEPADFLSIPATVLMGAINNLLAGDMITLHFKVEEEEFRSIHRHRAALFS